MATELKFLIWNLNKKNETLNVLEELYNELKPDFLLLIETPFGDNEIIHLSNYNLRSVMLDGFKTIRLYVSSSLTVQPINGQEQEQERELKVSDGQRRQIKERLIFFKLTINNENFLLVGIHFPSKFNNTTPAQQQIMKRWRGWIEEQERIIDTDKTILFGDFNLNPQEMAIYSQEGLSAHPTVNTLTKVKTKYYNPMWALMGDFIYKTDIPKVPGTYFRNIGEDDIDEIHWNILDGLLVKNSLVNNFSKKDLEIITQTTNHLLYENSQINPSYSYHLPIKFNFNL